MIKEDTHKTVCRALARLLVAHGVRRVFISPGSRNAPLIVAIARCEELQTTVVIDERCAGFMAMGYASVSGEPVALVCTSGTALLNYAPAVAEAYYRRLPLIVISADRPSEWIDQDDSQTLRQPGALDNYVKLSCDIPEAVTPNLEWYANRVINDALISASTGRKAPVHINIQLDVPLGVTEPVKALRPRVINVAEPRQDLDASIIENLRLKLSSPCRVLIIAGFNNPDARLDQALSKISEWDNVIILTETISNLHLYTGHEKSAHSRIDTILSTMSEEDKRELAPDIVITLGGALVSRFVKEYIRGLDSVEHWHVGIAHTTIDCFKHLTLRIELDPGIFFSQLASVPYSVEAHSDYKSKWDKIAYTAYSLHDTYLQSIAWSDMKAFDVFMPLIPKDCNVQFSNGTPVRYAQLFGQYLFHRSDCNRGVSGIDGCTSTAIGASLADDSRITMLISGDMSAQYDVGALATVKLTPHFKMIVMCNGGGGIFRFISQTASLSELDEFFAVGPDVPFRELAQGYGMAYFQADDEASLKDAFADFIAVSDRPAMLTIHTPALQSAEILRQYFKRNYRQ